MSTDAFQLRRFGLPGSYAVTAASNHHFPKHHHDLFGIGLIEQGAQKSWSGRGLVEAEAGNVITVNPGEVHDGTPLVETGRRWTILYIPPALVAAAADDIAPGQGTGFEFSQPVYHHLPLSQRLRALMVAGGDADAAEEALLSLLAPLLRPETAPQGTPHALLAIRDWIDAEPEADIPLAALAARADLSRFQLLRGFSRLTGLTPHAYRLQRRAQVARRLILSGTPLAEAAAASGFADQSHMTRLFRRVYGLSPGAFAKI